MSMYQLQMQKPIRNGCHLKIITDIENDRQNLTREQLSAQRHTNYHLGNFHLLKQRKMRYTILSLLIGLAGFVLLTCEAETTTALLLSKALAFGLMFIAYKLYQTADRKGELDKIRNLF